ncbi:MAG TPA: hypothetical protein ENN41_01325, partial [Sediminispirochaeta sp.]|nr:hypothetical protein [Sediminispirochaeta sp.]
MEKKDWSILFAIAILLLALGTTLFFIAQRKKQVSLQLFNTRIERIDGYIRDGNRSKALEEILDLADKDLSASSYIRLLKRVWEESFPGYGRDYELLAELSAKAHSQYPGSAELRALASYSLLRTGSEVEAARIFFEDPPPADRWDALRKELSLYLPPEQKDETSTGIADLGMDSDPEVFIDFYSDTGNPGFLTNALLVELRRGRIDDAYRLAQRYRNEKLPGKLLLFLHYDAGQWDGALELLERYPQMFPKEEHLLLTADIYMRQGDYEAARDVYWRLMPSFDALYNTLYIDLVQGKNDPMEMIDRWWNEETPGEGRMIELAELLLAEGDPESAEQLLDRLDAGKERAAAVSLLRERSRERINPARYSSLLWTLLYQEEEEKYAVHLSWFLMGIGDAAGLHNLIEYG